MEIFRVYGVFYCFTALVSLDRDLTCGTVNVFYVFTLKGTEFAIMGGKEQDLQKKRTSTCGDVSDVVVCGVIAKKAVWIVSSPQEAC